MLHFLRAILGLSLAAAIFAGCGAEGGGETTTVTTGAGAETATGGITVVERDFYFAPNTISGPAEATITLDIRNEGGVVHNLTIADQGIDEDTAPGGSASVDVRIPSTGSIQFVCSFHAAQGMTGTLAASSPQAAEAAPPATTTQPAPSVGY